MTIRKRDFEDLELERLRDFFFRAFEPHGLGEFHLIGPDAFSFIGEPYKVAWSKWNRLRDYSYGEVKVLEKEDRWVISFIGNPKRILSTGGLYAISLSGLFFMASRDLKFALLFGLSFSTFNALLSIMSSRYRMKRLLDSTRRRMMLAR